TESTPNPDNTTRQQPETNRRPPPEKPISLHTAQLTDPGHTARAQEAIREVRHDIMTSPTPRMDPCQWDPASLAAIAGEKAEPTMSAGNSTLSSVAW
ncbi:hypothetical protein, partial [uncultured Propionibacterium sp.]|uniref:hypothetical protein n=1 Tax=uncultured Propionibacterium sp. TaxID=218066 RepID=UPI002931E659